MEKRLADKRIQWIDVLSGKDSNSINQQIVHMVWDAASYRVVNEARRLAPSASSGGVQLSGLLHELLDRGFFVSQMVSIRRLCDESPLDGKKGVNSLLSLLNDIIRYQDLLCRRPIFDAEGIEYDWAKIEQKRTDFYRERGQRGQEVCFLPLELSPDQHDSRHRQIDFLSGADSLNRSPTDRIRDELLQNLKKKILSSSEHVVNHVNKFIAHAARPESRKLVNAERFTVTLNYIWNAHRQICEVMSFLSEYVLGLPEQQNILATSHSDQFEYIEQPLVTLENVHILRKIWSDFDEESSAWVEWRPDKK